MQPVTKDIILVYFAGHATMLQKQMIEEWLQHPGNIELYYEWMEEWEARHPQFVPDLNKALTSFQKKIADTITTEENGQQQATAGISHTKKSILRAAWFRWAAACAAAVIIYSVFYEYQAWSNKPWYAGNPAVKANTQQTNSSGKPLLIKLEDGSSITLQPGSSISYPGHFLAGKREVYLDGDAFFTVSKNPTRPFYVYNHYLTTHVLGTSFTIQTNKENGLTEVSVKTGKVEVYETDLTAPANKNEKSRRKAVVLTPNQKVAYHQKQDLLETALVEVPLPVPKNNEDTASNTESFAFDEAPLSRVLATISNYYGIEIIVENESLNQYPFTGDISGKGLYRQLDIICSLVKASYEVKGTKIFLRDK